LRCGSELQSGETCRTAEWRSSSCDSEPRAIPLREACECLPSSRTARLTRERRLAHTVWVRVWVWVRVRVRVRVDAREAPGAYGMG